MVRDPQGIFGGAQEDVGIGNHLEKGCLGNQDMERSSAFDAITCRLRGPLITHLLIH